MPNAADVFFGTSPSATTTNAELMTPEQKAALNKSISDMMASGAPAAATKGMGLSLSALEQQSLNTVQYNDEASKAIDRLIKSGGSPLDINDVFTKGVEQPMLFDFQNKVLPMLQSSFAGSNAFGSDKMKQQELLTNNLMKNLTGSRSSMVYQSQNDALNRLLAAAGIAPQIQASTTRSLTDTLGAQRGALDPLTNLIGQRSVEPVTTVTPGSQGMAGQLAAVMTAMLMNGKGSMGGLLGGLGSGVGMGIEGIGDILKKIFVGGTTGGMPTDAGVLAAGGDLGGLGDTSGMVGGSNPLTDFFTKLFGGDSAGSLSGGAGADMLAETAGNAGGFLSVLGPIGAITGAMGIMDKIDPYNTAGPDPAWLAMMDAKARAAGYPLGRFDPGWAAANPSPEQYSVSGP